MEYLLLLTLLLHGSPELQAKEAATQLVRDALAAYEAGDYTTAADRYLRAYQLANSHGLPDKPELLYNAGLAFDLAGRCDRAIELFERFAESSAQRPEDLEERLAKARECAPLVGLSTIPSGATVTVDGEARGQTPIELHLLRGERTVRFELEGYRAIEETLSIAGARELRRKLEAEDHGELVLEDADTSTVFLDGERIEAGVPALAVGRHAIRFERAGCAPASEEIEIKPGRSTSIGPGPCIALEREEARPLPTYALVSGGVGAAGLIAGIALSVLARNAVQRRDNELAKPEDAISGKSVRAAQDEAVRLTVGAYVSFAVAGVGLVTGAVLLFVNDGRSAGVSTDAGVMTVEW